MSEEIDPKKIEETVQAFKVQFGEQDSAVNIVLEEFFKALYDVKEDAAPEIKPVSHEPG